MSVGITNFARRHTSEGPFSHFDGDFDALCALVEENLGAIVDLAPGVAKVTLPGEGFHSALTQITPDTPLVGYFEARRDCEAPFISVRAKNGPKVPAVEVDIILYAAYKLAEDPDEQGHDADWLIVSINAKTFSGEEPMNPVTMARNYLGLAGGSQRDYSPEEFARSIVHWLGGDGSAPYVLLDINQDG